MYSNRLDSTRSFLSSSVIRQTLILLVVFTVITLIAWLLTYWIVIRDTNQLVEQHLEALVDSAELALEQGASLPDTRPGQYLALLHLDVVQQGSLPSDISIAQKRPGFHFLESSEGSGQNDYVVLIRETASVRIVAAENVERLEETTDLLLAGLQFALVTTLLATFLAGFWIARKNQARLDKISDGLARVSHGELSTRIDLPGPNDDLSLLADRIDATTARLETAMTQMRVQTANIAHDLRTPLARLRALVEESHTGLVDRGEPVRGEVLDDALEQIDQIVDTFNAILRITRIESGDQKSSFIPVALGDLVDNVNETFGPVIEDQGQSLEIGKSQPALISGDPDMILQLLGNLIQNALRHGADGQMISLVVAGSTLSVTDQGPGIPFDERERVLRPLYQRETQRQGDGYGLGLALVSAICDLHDAKLTLTTGPDTTGLKVQVQFPELR